MGQAGAMSKNNTSKLLALKRGFIQQNFQKLMNKSSASSTDFHPAFRFGSKIRSSKRSCFSTNPSKYNLASAQISEENLNENSASKGFFNRSNTQDVARRRGMHFGIWQHPLIICHQ